MSTSVAVLSLTDIIQNARSRTESSASSSITDKPVGPSVRRAAGTMMRSVMLTAPVSDWRASSTSTAILKVDASTTGSSAPMPNSLPLARSRACM